MVLSQDNEVNGITFGGVGAGTTVDFVQVRMALDDCFEFFGGTVNAKHLVCQWNQDDGFDFDQRLSGQAAVSRAPAGSGARGRGQRLRERQRRERLCQSAIHEPAGVQRAPSVAKNADVDNAQFGDAHSPQRTRHVREHGHHRLRGEPRHPRRHGRLPPLKPVATEPQFDLKSTLFFGAKGRASSTTSVSGDGRAAPNKDNDTGVDEVSWVKSATRQNLEAGPGRQLLRPDGADLRPGGLPSRRRGGPPNDGFFEPSAYLGAFKDASDNWATTGRVGGLVEQVIG